MAVQFKYISTFQILAVTTDQQIAAIPIELCKSSNKVLRELAS